MKTIKTILTTLGKINFFKVARILIAIPFTLVMFENFTNDFIHNLKNIFAIIIGLIIILKMPSVWEIYKNKII